MALHLLGKITALGHPRQDRYHTTDTHDSTTPTGVIKEESVDIRRSEGTHNEGKYPEDKQMKRKHQGKVEDTPSTADQNKIEQNSA